jgi:hypothetical protein
MYRQIEMPFLVGRQFGKRGLFKETTDIFSRAKFIT